MKVCPTCDKEYVDDEINFCLSDGSTLRTRHGKGFWISFLRLLQIVALLGFVTSCGSCVSCVVLHEPTFGQVEEYAPGKMGAKTGSVNEESEKVMGLVALGGAAVFLVIGFASLVLRESLND